MNSSSPASSRDKIIEQIEIIKELKQITEINAKASSKNFWVSLWISILAIIISISLGTISYKSAKDWQKQQLISLQEQNNLLIEQNKILNQQNKYLNELQISIKTFYKNLNQQKK